MNRNATILSCCGVVVFLVVLYFLWPISYNWSVKNSPAAPDAVFVAFGDSLTRGHGAPAASSYPQQLSGKLNHNVINEGINGLTTRDAPAHLDKVLRHKPTVVLLTLGGNDLMRKIKKEETISNLRNLFRALQKEGILVVYGLIHPPLVEWAWTDAIRQLCAEEGILAVPPVLEGLWSDSTKMADRIHPNAKGYTIVAERFYQRLKSHLAK